MAVGYQGQYIFVVPAQNLVAVFTSGLPGRKFLLPRNLLQDFIIPAASSAAALPVDEAGQLRLKALAARAARGPADGYIWHTAAEGNARAGRFVRRAAPAFQFSYSPGSRKESLLAPRQVMRMKTLSSTPFAAAILDIPPGVALAEVGPNTFVALLRQSGLRNINVQSNRMIRLADGTPAYKTHFTWQTKGALDLTTFLVSVFRDGKWVYLSAHPWRNLAEASQIVESLSFQVPD